MKKSYMVTSIKPWFNFFSSTLVQKHVVNFPSLHGRNHCKLRIRTNREWSWFQDSKWFVIKSSRKPWNNCPLNIVVRKVFCWSALHGEKPYQVQHSNIQGWTWFDDAKRFVMMISRKASNISPQTDWFEKCFWLSAFYGKTSSSSESE